MRLPPWRHVQAPDPPDPAVPAAEAVASRERAEAELGRQQAAMSEEHRDVLAPLRRMREKNHIAEDFIELIKRGYS